jgi:hypothetical protein
MLAGITSAVATKTHSDGHSFSRYSGMGLFDQTSALASTRDR